MFLFTRLALCNCKRVRLKADWRRVFRDVRDSLPPRWLVAIFLFTRLGLGNCDGIIYNRTGEGVRLPMLLACCLIVGEAPVGMARTVWYEERSLRAPSYDVIAAATAEAPMSL